MDWSKKSHFSAQLILKLFEQGFIPNGRPTANAALQIGVFSLPSQIEHRLLERAILQTLQVVLAPAVQNPRYRRHKLGLQDAHVVANKRVLVLFDNSK
uniref:Uncharacterized protein n=1 Tax=Romanomermis culicivorax TaxID=13658 RepID=A0A915IWV6_ROMCU